jgi:hypothetical protein
MLDGNRKAIAPELWGKDHWAAFAYLDWLAMNYNGVAQPDLKRMRTNEKTHPALVGSLFGNRGGSAYATRLKVGEVVGHDDWDCVDDAVEAGLVKDIGTGINRAFVFTKRGNRVMAELNAWKKQGKNFRDFQPSQDALNEPIEKDED